MKHLISDSGQSIRLFIEAALRYLNMLAILIYPVVMIALEALKRAAKITP